MRVIRSLKIKVSDIGVFVILAASVIGSILASFNAIFNANIEASINNKEAERLRSSANVVAAKSEKLQEEMDKAKNGDFSDDALRENGYAYPNERNYSVGS